MLETISDFLTRGILRRLSILFRVCPGIGLCLGLRASTVECAFRQIRHADESQKNRQGCDDAGILFHDDALIGPTDGGPSKSLRPTILNNQVALTTGTPRSSPRFPVDRNSRYGRRSRSVGTRPPACPAKFGHLHRKRPASARPD